MNANRARVYPHIVGGVEAALEMRDERSSFPLFLSLSLSLLSLYSYLSIYLSKEMSMRDESMREMRREMRERDER